MTTSIATLVSNTERKAAANIALVAERADVQSTYELAVELFRVTQSVEDGGLGLSLAKVAELVGTERARLHFPSATAEELASLAVEQGWNISKASAARYVASVRIVNEACVEVNPYSVSLVKKGHRAGTSTEWGELVKASRGVDWDYRETFFNNGALAIIAAGNAANNEKIAAARSERASGPATDDESSHTVTRTGMTVEQVLSTLAAASVQLWSETERATLMSALLGFADNLDRQGAATAPVTA